MTINCDDMDAARLAILILGRGWYGIEGALPLLAMGNSHLWAQQTYGKNFQEWANSIDEKRIAAALESVANVGERTSLNDIVKQAHGMAENIRRKAG